MNTPKPPNKHQLALMIWLAVFPTLTVLNMALGGWLRTLHPVFSHLRARHHRGADRHLRSDAAAAPHPRPSPHQAANRGLTAMTTTRRSEKTMLTRLAHLIVRHRWTVIGMWIVLTAFGAVAAGQVSSRWYQSTSIPGQPAYEASQRSLRRIRHRRPLAQRRRVPHTR